MSENSHGLLFFLVGRTSIHQLDDHHYVGQLGGSGKEYSLTFHAWNCIFVFRVVKNRSEEELVLQVRIILKWGDEWIEFSEPMV